VSGYDSYRDFIREEEPPFLHVPFGALRYFDLPDLLAKARGVKRLERPDNVEVATHLQGARR
jgi:hypothetical protein